MITLPKSKNPRVPDAKYPFRHHLPLQLRFNDIDGVGHVNNSVYFQFSDLGKFRYMQDVVGQMHMSDIRALIVNVNCDFFAPTVMDENVEILTAVDKIGPKSIHVEQRVVNVDTLETKAIVRTVLAGWDPKTGKSAPIDPAMVEKIEQFEQRKLS